MPFFNREAIIEECKPKESRHRNSWLLSFFAFLVAMHKNGFYRAD